MRIHMRIACSEVNGPGKRAVIWTQGCSLGCKGCWNPETWDRNGGDEVTVNDLVTWVLAMRTLTPDLCGVTFSGGEPLQQIDRLEFLFSRIHRAWPECSIGMFTGYTLREAEKMPLWLAVRDHLDWAVMGRYVEVLASKTLPLLGSSNQKVELFSERYTTADFVGKQKLEVLSKVGEITFTGFPQHKKEELVAKMSELGVKLK